MKAKIFFLLAAIMLSCASAFAQSGPIDPAKGDVNEDGTVDVADMVSIIKIMKDGGGAIGAKQAYWYAGTNDGNAVTADNFTDVASKIPESEIPAAGFVTANGQYVYIVLPETRHIESLTDVNNADVEFTCTDVMGYHIYKTTELINTQINYTVAQTVYYWYVGKSIPESINGDGWTLLGTDLSGVSYIQADTSNDPDYTFPKFYVVLPTSLNFKPYNADGSKDESALWTSSTWSVNNAYTLWSLGDNTSDINSRFKKEPEMNYYWYVGQEIPTEISGTVDYDNGGGWTSTGNSVPDTIYQLVKGFDRNKEIFVLVPITEGTTLKPVMSDLSTIDTAVQEVEEKILNNVNYKVYNYGSDSIRKTIMLVKK